MHEYRMILGPTSELLLSSLPVFCHNSSDENVESDNFDAPKPIISHSRQILEARRTNFGHVLVDQSLNFLLYAQSQRKELKKTGMRLYIRVSMNGNMVVRGSYLAYEASSDQHGVRIFYFGCQQSIEQTPRIK